MVVRINKLIILLVAFFAFATSCVKEEVPAENPVGKDKKVILKSLLAGRDTKWTVDDLDIPTLNGEWYEIRSVNELAYLLEFGSTKGEKFRLMADVDVTSSSIADKFSGEIGAESFENFEFDGNGKTISGLDLPLAAGLFSRVKDSRIYNLTLASSTVGSADNVSNLLGTGAVVGSTSGTLEVSNVTISACNVYAPCKIGGFVGAVTDGSAAFTSCKVNDANVNGVYLKGVSGWCGGFVGFIGRTREDDTSISVDASFADCDINGGAVKPYMESAQRTCGQFLGMLIGFDPNEKVTMTGCDVETAYTGQDAASQANPHYIIGGHKYDNGVILVDGLSYARPWDGVTTKQPALSGGVYNVYTAEELAWFQGKTETTSKILIRKDIDLAGHLFTPIYKANHIDGNNCEIRNLKVFKNDCGKTDGGAFIRQASGTTVHKNIIFRNADIRSEHDPAQIAVAGGNAYCATLCSNVEGTYTMENVHAVDGKLYGVNKMGGLLGRVCATSTITGCSVSNYYIENYEVPEAPETFTALGGLISATFYPQGEVGGMIGFIQSNATISDCHVYSTDINAYGQADKYGGMVPGRHVGTVIGDVRTSSNSVAYTVTITDTGADAETLSLSKAHNKTLNEFSNAAFIGKCYNVANDDYRGTVSVNGTKVL